MKASKLRASVLDRVYALRDRLVGSKEFRERASRNLLTRPVAQHNARSLFDLCAGFVYSQVLFACVRLDLFRILSEGPQDLATLARRLKLEESEARRLLRAAASLGLVSVRGEARYGLGTLGAAMLDNPGVAAMVEHHAHLYADLADPVALLRGDAQEKRLARYWAYAEADDPRALPAEAIDEYTALMGASQAMIAQEVLATNALATRRRLLDVGGGDGTFLMEVAKRVPDLQLMLFDLPSVAARAEARFAQAGLGQRAAAVGGDFLREPLPLGADVISLVRILHDHDYASVMTLLRAAHAALPRDGMLLIAEPMAPVPGRDAAAEAYFGFYLLAMGSGRPRAVGELQAMLREAGFARSQQLGTPTPVLARALVAFRDGATV
ncbi:methyltransferase [Afifella aestuarii]|uniref:methyltransferase n=1 Tax=Afifella aestuarii TaxID=1909496 RepID=UPI000FE2D74B|nr:methyltransferase [Afifella aestuarii]